MKVSPARTSRLRGLTRLPRAQRFKRYKHTVFGDVGRWAHNIGYEAIACGQDMVQCAKTERQCLNSCSGVDNSDLSYDFHTIVGITELGVISLGAEGHAAAEANCSI